MSEQGSYWTRRMISRRAALRGALAAGGGLAALSLAGCGGDDDDDSGGSTAGQTTTEQLDWKQGKPGGKLVFQQFADPGSIVLVRTRNAGATQLGSFTHSGLWGLNNGHPGVEPSATTSELDVAVAFPEQPADQLTYIIKIRPDVKFQNGRLMTAEDVKYSWDRYAFAGESAYKSEYTWLDKVETPSADTIIIKTKTPYADAIGSMNARNENLILLKEHEESPDAPNKLMGSGPFIMMERQPPVLVKFKRNPDYFNKPWPYFDEMDVLGTSDSAKRVADFVSKQTHVTYWFSEEQRDQIKQQRPDGKLWGHQYSSYTLIFKNDTPPWNDKRFRQALSMTIDRKAIRDATTKGDGEPDQGFTWVIKTWGFRKPGELPSAKNWNFDVAAAKQLLSAVGYTSPMDTKLAHWDPTVIGQSVVDSATLLATTWKNNGIINTRDEQLTFGQTSTTTAVGNYEGMYIGPGSGGGVIGPAPGNTMKNIWWSPPEGPKTPSPNNAKIADPQLNALIEKQLTQFNLDERKQTFKQMEEIAGEQQYRVSLSTITNNFFSDPALRNIQVPIFHVNGSSHYVKYWWFVDGKNP